MTNNYIVVVNKNNKYWYGNWTIKGFYWSDWHTTTCDAMNANLQQGSNRYDSYSTFY